MIRSFKIKYSRQRLYNIEKLPSDNIDRLSTSMVPSGSKLLELGCSSGYHTKYFSQIKKCSVIGLDINKNATMEARRWAKKVLVADLNHTATWYKIKKLGRFDVVFASEVLEHLIDPWFALKEIHKILKNNGLFIVTVPNVAFWKQRLALLKGKWNYEDYGILDKTHNKFFTIFSIRKALKQSGFRILDEKYDPAGGAKQLTPFLEKFPNLYAYQIAIKSVKK